MNIADGCYRTIRQTAARRVYELRVEHDRAEKEFRDAETRRNELSKQLRDAEGQLCKSVGGGISEKLWRVSDGVSVIARYHSNTCTTVSVLYDEPTE